MIPLIIRLKSTESPHQGNRYQAKPHGAELVAVAEDQGLNDGEPNSCCSMHSTKVMHPKPAWQTKKILPQFPSVKPGANMAITDPLSHRQVIPISDGSNRSFEDILGKAQPLTGTNHPHPLTNTSIRCYLSVNGQKMDN